MMPKKKKDKPPLDAIIPLSQYNPSFELGAFSCKKNSHPDKGPP
jgi:hypothetical protein